MKWFRHDSDAHNNLKFQELLDRYKMIGYGVWWVCCELVANQSDPKKGGFSISKKKNWTKRLRKITGISGSTLDGILQLLAESNLISKKALKSGSLSIPKMKDRMDDYSERVRRVFEQSKNNVPVQHNTTHNNTKHNNTPNPLNNYKNGKELLKEKMSFKRSQK